MKTRLTPIQLLVVLAICALMVQEIVISNYTVDDAFISFRYARNLVEGSGLVFNVGERVEGYTNFLWTILMAGALLLKANPEIVAKLLGILASAGSVTLVYRISSLTRPAGSPWPLSLVAVAALTANGAFATSAITGLETSLFSFLVLAGAFVIVRAEFFTIKRDHAERPVVTGRHEALTLPSPIYERERGRGFLPPKNGEKSPSGANGSPLPLRWERARVRAPSLTIRQADWRDLCPIFFALAALTRPEGLVAFGASIVLVASSHSFQRDDLKACIRWLIIFATIYVPYSIWRLNYYGDLLPNTFYAKTGAGLAQSYVGILDLKDFSLAYLGIVFVVAVFVLARRKAPFWLTYVTGMTVLFALIDVYEGGDWIPFFRFLVPALPFYYLVIQEAVRSLYANIQTRFHGPLLDFGFGLGFLSLVVLTAVPSFAMFGELVRASSGQERAHAALGRWLRDNGQGPVALMDIGRIGYISRLPIVDTSGLTDRTIAHASGGLIDKKFDLAYVLDRQPRYLVLASTTDFIRANSGPTDFPIEKRIYEDRRFHEQFVYRFTLEWGTVVDDKGYYLMVYERK